MIEYIHNCVMIIYIYTELNDDNIYDNIIYIYLNT